ncbi:hypothetical protein [Fredinandcohnia onubensis]|uniref:hypothetical protein n=1 Tax=Fredinandcohnia onubensis TaxID=1571209 RepID=UPI000C0BC0D6|nr:hypothetical protein [Fredinandcohnia onubensis]
MLFYLMIALFAVGIGAIGCGIFMFFVKMEKKKAFIISLIGLFIIVVTMSSGNLRPSYEKETSIIVQEVSVSSEKNGDGEYSCNVSDPYSVYQFYSEDKKEVEDFCAQFSKGETYEITYQFKSGKYTILGVIK